jgi:hypothetical protein
MEKIHHIHDCLRNTVGVTPPLNRSQTAFRETRISSYHKKPLILHCNFAGNHGYLEPKVPGTKGSWDKHGQIHGIPGEIHEIYEA